MGNFIHRQVAKALITNGLSHTAAEGGAENGAEGGAEGGAEEAQHQSAGSACRDLRKPRQKPPLPMMRTTRRATGRTTGRATGRTTRRTTPELRAGSAAAIDDAGEKTGLIFLIVTNEINHTSPQNVPIGKILGNHLVYDRPIRQTAEVPVIDKHIHLEFAGRRIVLPAVVRNIGIDGIELQSPGAAELHGIFQKLSLAGRPQYQLVMVSLKFLQCLNCIRNLPTDRRIAVFNYGTVKVNGNSHIFSEHLILVIVAVTVAIAVAITIAVAVAVIVSIVGTYLRSIEHNTEILETVLIVKVLNLTEHSPVN